jgi:integrase
MWKMESVRHKNVSITVYQVNSPPGSWQFQYSDADGRTKRITRTTLKSVRQAATAKAVEIQKGTIDISTLNHLQLGAVRRMLEADPSLSSIDEFLVWRSRKNPEKNTAEAIAEFLEMKERNRGKSSLNVQNLTRHLKLIPQKPNLCDITPAMLEASFPANIASRTRINMRGVWVTFFRWARKMEHLPHDEEQTAADKIERPIVERSIPTTYSSEEIKTLLAAVSDDYLPWLVLSSFAGIRSEELSPSPKSDKSPLDWSDFHWDRSIIIIRPETDKNRQRRVIRILPPVAAFLKPIAKKSGRVSPVLAPAQPRRGGELSETTRLGNLIGGWKRNAPRHSFISYRAAQVGIAQTAMEAGNSESEAKKSYNDAKSKEEAEAWFGITKLE